MSTRKKPLVEYLIRCRLEYEAEVVVNATDPEDAERRFNAMDWEGEPVLMDMPNWVMQGKPRVNE